MRSHELEESPAAKSTILVMPAYNAARTLRATYDQIAPGIIDEVILVDDSSQDATLDVAKSLNIRTVAHPHNVGYGGNQKTCYLEAIRQGADVVIMLHPDGQYDPSFLGELVDTVRSGADVVLGSRMLNSGQAKEGGMPGWKRSANKLLTGVENAVLQLKLSEYHTGYRAYSRRFLTTVPFMRNSNDFVFDSEILVQAVAFGFEIVEIPVTTRYFSDASSVGFSDGVIYGTKTLVTLGRYALHRRGLRSRLFQR